MARSRVSVLLAAAALVLAIAALAPPLAAAGDAAAAEPASAEPAAAEAVLTLDASNFDETVAKHQFVVVEFYAPWCGHCKNLAPEYEKAAFELSKHDPPVVLAKVDANEEQNKELASKYEVKGFPTLKIFRSEGKIIQDYKGPREAEGIIEYLKKQVGPASAEIKLAEDASNLINDQKVIIVGVFSEFSGEEFKNFIAVAEKLRSDYDFRHTLDAKLLPRGESTTTLPVVRLFKPFDELFVDSKDFEVEALEGFIQSASVPIVTFFNKEPNNRPYLVKFFNNPNTKAMLFLDFSNKDIDVFKSKYHEVAGHFKAQNISFLMGDLDASKDAFQFFGLKEDQVPLILIQESDGLKYVKPHLQPDQIVLCLNEYTDGNLKPFKKSEPIPEANDEPVKVIVADNFHDMVFSSGKNVLIEFYAPWCGHCKKLAPILEEVAVSFQDNADVVIAKLDATTNDVPKDFEVKGFPTLYFSSASGKLLQYDGNRTAEDIINFVQENRDTTVEPSSTEEKQENRDTTVKPSSTEEKQDPIKDEL